MCRVQISKVCRAIELEIKMAQYSIAQILALVCLGGNLSNKIVETNLNSSTNHYH